MLRGECNCGAIAFEVTRPATGIIVCHCSICRRATGANGIPVVVVANEDFRWVRGQADIATWRKSDGDWQRWFCRTCGSPVPGINDPDRMFVPAGLLDENDLVVTHHIWVASKARWDAIGDAGIQHPREFGS